MVRHMYGPAASNGDNDSLQADVMRFMAIIAFCLIAILALVRNVEPAPTESAQPPPPTEATAPEPRRIALLRSQPQTPIEPQRAQRIDEPAAVTPASRSQAPAPVMPAPAPERKVVIARPAPSPAATAQPEPAAQDPAEPATAAEPPREGLSLRFASDGDFLRLIARGEIQVYAYRPDTVLKLSSTYTFVPTGAPGQVFELLPATIPALIRQSLGTARAEPGDADTFTWAIGLPREIRAQLDSHMTAVDSGQLVIDRYGEVHHVSAD